MKFALPIPTQFCRKRPLVRRVYRVLALCAILPVLAAGCTPKPLDQAVPAADAGARPLAAARTAPKPAAAASTPLPSGWSKQGQGVFQSQPAWTFMPSTTMNGGARALLIVLHGCNQNFDQLKEFGNLEGVATQRGILLAIPDVGTKHFGDEMQRCWDYDMAQDKHQNMDNLVAIAESLAAPDSGNKVDRKHIYVVGLSSGGAMALTVACQRPDLFAGVGSVAGPSVGSSQYNALSEPFNFSFGSWSWGNVKTMESTCRSLAEKAGVADHFKTQIANIAVGDMDDNSKWNKNSQYHYFSDLQFTQAACDHAGQLAVVSKKWSDDNVAALRAIYGTDALGAEQALPNGEATKRAALKDGKERIAFVRIKNVGHAWPAGTGSASCSPSKDPAQQSAGLWIAQKGLNYPELVTHWLLANNLRGGNPVAVSPASGAGDVSNNAGSR